MELSTAAAAPSSSSDSFHSSDLLVGYFIHAILKLRGVPEKLRLYSVLAWLFNPFTFTIGTRGNCEPIVCAIVLWIIICLMRGLCSSPSALWDHIPGPKCLICFFFFFLGFWNAVPSKTSRLPIEFSQGPSIFVFCCIFVSFTGYMPIFLCPLPVGV